MIHQGITILDQNLKPCDSIGIGGDWKVKILDKIVNWAKNQDTKIVSVVRLVHPGEAAAFGVDDTISIGTQGTGTVKFGIWKVYGDVSTIPKGNPRLTQEELHKKYLNVAKDYYIKASDVKRWEKIKKQSYRPFTPNTHYIPFTKSNPRKKEMNMGAPDKKASLSKILDEIDETPNEYRFRMMPPSKFHEDSLKYGSKSITTGVRAIYGCLKDAWAPRLQKCKKGMVMQSLRLSKDVFHSATEAAGWIAKHTKPKRK